jgi:hypothetical protein
VERGAQIAIMLVIGAAAGAGSFRHVHDVAAAHGQAGWLAWSDAVVLELMSVAAGLELRRRKQTHAPVRFPATVMATAVILSLGAQVADAQPSPIGWIAAAIPAPGFLAMVKIALAQQGTPAPSSLPEASPHHPSELHMPSEPPSMPDPIVELLVPAARAAAAALTRQGRRVSRHALAEAQRADGHAVSNARTSALLALLKAEPGQTPQLHVLAGPSHPPAEPATSGSDSFEGR